MRLPSAPARKRIAAVLAVVLSAAVSWAALLPAGFPDEQRLSGPAHTDFAWKLLRLPPKLTLQQRYVVQVEVAVPGSSLRNAVGHHDLYFLARVMDDQGHWFKGQAMTHRAPAGEVDAHTEVDFVSAFYARPGTYDVVAVLFDAADGRWDLGRSRVEVPSFAGKPLPEMHDDWPAVEFVPNVPDDLADAYQGPAYFGTMGPTVSRSSVDAEWPLGEGRSSLPVVTAEATEVDLLLNFAGLRDATADGDKAPWIRRRNAGLIVQAASVLAAIKPSSGCTRVTALDIARQQVLLPAGDAAQVNWQAFARKMEANDGSLVNVKQLRGRGSAPVFFRDYLRNIVQSPGCGPTMPPHRFVIVISGAQQFGVPLDKLGPGAARDCRYYYFQTRVIPHVVANGGQKMVNDDNWDDLREMLKPVAARVFEISDAMTFRKQVAEVIGAIAAVSQPRKTR